MFRRNPFADFFWTVVDCAALMGTFRVWYYGWRIPNDAVGDPDDIYALGAAVVYPGDQATSTSKRFW